MTAAVDPESKIRMWITDITREGGKLAVTVGIGHGEITLFAFDNVREFPLKDLLKMLEREKEYAHQDQVFKEMKRKALEE